LEISKNLNRIYLIKSKNGGKKEDKNLAKNKSKKELIISKK